ncbi:Lipopolysaccharide-modifying protein [Apiospora aurea]|uniref:Lipopolysaccharide-modifying protein n=1 Tax=Apiospora aurea TaxID=335848 RepID=A0ABR1Q6N8_9PEZI
MDLIKEGHEKFARLQAARSNTIEEAAGRYRERRGRHPPPGFDDWFKAAQKRDAVIVEDFFDRIYHDINPFWALDQPELRRRAHSQPEVIRIRSGKVSLVSEDPERGNQWMQIWAKLVKEIGHLPDLDMAINVMDEPRVLVPWEKIDEYVRTERRTRDMFPASEAVSTYTGDSRNISSLPSFNGPVKDIYPTGPVDTYTYKGFVRNFTTSQDACVQPHLRGLHGTFVESVSMSTTHELLPIFGGSKIGGLWEGKMEGFMWRGVASGGRNKVDNWWHFQRHRWAQMMNGTTLQKVIAADEAAAPHVCASPAQRVDSKKKRVHTCSYSSPFLDVVKEKPMKEQYAYKYLPDIDGNSFSGRWRGFLRSTSCPLKATVYTEWHDGRLVPWVHFVPFDNTFMDIYAIMEFFLESHDAQGRRIAEEGSRWASQALRKDDMLLYVWRLLLEYARVVDPQRNRLAFVGDLVQEKT